MAQEQFAGPDHYTEFDPEKFVRDLKVQKSVDEDDKGGKAASEKDAAGIDDTAANADSDSADQV
ncbi:hypothetical protein KBP53_08130 [Corynebacterium genitalium ATCC 33030]|uniref:Uncharacterized protein n=1 Tax=Corynebacterium genitalium ATCC 33030 TaxID=585529 RepID=D7WEG2_9CORY|nr:MULTISPECIES: hypothetical protein [Corynebacterium]MCQ4618317.1 hypothetical protein [Corynebacterium pseudogenitalium]EFK53539.1 hypothetical protein HMPREF0291_11196 [Corynebacterium genitalium ATCC 33030]MCQ4621548.1 hypothetical protein [Corynebacterium sp. CCUG 71335]MCQ4624532.1 hypothetical protein [Corynebacterium sp. CCUG 69979]MCQ4628055.1 hypothetical protein [Corynebacterium sp. CCUG 65737]